MQIYLITFDQRILEGFRKHRDLNLKEVNFKASDENNNSFYYEPSEELQFVISLILMCFIN